MRPDPLRTVLRLLEVRPWRVVRAVALGTLALGCSVGLSAVSAWLIARASQMPPVLTLSVAVVTVRATGIGRGLLRYLERLASHDIALGGMAALRANLYDALARGPVTGVVGLRRGELLARVGADVDDVGDLVVRSLVPAGVAAAVGLGSVALVGAFLPSAALTLLACLFVTGVVAPSLASRAAATTEARSAQARAEVTARTLGILEEGQQQRVAGRLDDELAALALADRRLTAAGDDGARVFGVSAAIGAAAQTVAVVAALWLGMGALADGTLAEVELAVIVLTPLAVFEATSVLPAAAVQLRRSREAATRLAALIPPPQHSADTPVNGQVDATHAAGRPRAEAAERVEHRALLTLTGVDVGWSPTRPAVRGVDLELRPGSIVALTGPSGVGKTTLLMTAAGLLAPLAGTVTGSCAGRTTGASTGASTAVGGAGAGTDGPQVLLVTEDAHVFDTTVLENLRVARGDLTESQAREALVTLGLGDWLDALPAGLDTVIGGGATTVSGGERRRLLVARALLNPARVLLVDEPAEHLDADAADAVVHALAEHARATGRAVVIATHRLAAARAADEVLLLTQDHPAPPTTAGTGAAVTGHGTADAPQPAVVGARGTHAELLRDIPHYAWAAAREGPRAPTPAR